MLYFLHYVLKIFLYIKNRFRTTFVLFLIATLTLDKIKTKMFTVLNLEMTISRGYLGIDSKQIEPKNKTTTHIVLCFIHNLTD